MTEKEVLLSQLVSAVRKVPKFSNIHLGLINRIAKEEINKGRKLKEAIKTTKKKLHQIGSAYQQNKNDYSNWIQIIKNTKQKPDKLKTACTQIMEYNTSTRERLPIINTFYAEIFSHLPPIHSVLDVACGLNPLAIPWMQLEENASYAALDIYSDMIGFLDEYFKLLQIDGNAILCDVISELPTANYDLAIILKAVSCLDHIEKDAGIKILDNLNADHILISYPIHSLGGKSKGMLENYTEKFYVMVDEKNWKIKKFEFLTELAFLISK